SAAEAQSSLSGYNCPSSCQLPKCKCATSSPPVANPPQFLLVTFDDSMQTEIMNSVVYPLFANRRNPNGCPPLGTYFAQVWDANPFELTKWYAQGHEIADHSVTHVSPFAGSYAEIEGMRAWANKYAGIPLGKIQGVRYPFRNYSVTSLNMLSKMGFLYESSMAAYGSSGESIWPYTMDYGVVSDCLGQTSACNNKDLQAPGLWEVPMMQTVASDGTLHLMDPYNDPSLTAPYSASAVTDMYTKAFDALYNGNRAPFGVYTHPVWLQSIPGAGANAPIPDGTQKMKAVQDFLTYAMSKPDVWMVTHQQLIKYMQNPVPASQLGSQSYMQCTKPVAPPTNICNGLSNTGVDLCSNLARGTFQSCYGCPGEYPSLANPAPPSQKCSVPTNCDTLFWNPATCTCLCTSTSCAYNDTARPINLDPNSLNQYLPGGTPVSNNGTKTNAATPKSGASPVLVSGILGMLMLAFGF
ncbi:hypothetical protein EDD86DRAFT_262198, partial [Gorgonomyces haynaldii]